MAKTAKTNIYAWQLAREKIHKFVTDLDNPHVFTAWIKAQLVIEAQARYHHHVGHTVEDAVAMAWEDFDMAARGKGEPSVAGAVFILWSRLPKKHDSQLQKTLTEAFRAAQEGTEPNRLRYHISVRDSRVLTLQDNFDLVEAFPIDLQPITETLNNAKDIKRLLDSVQGFKDRGFTLIDGGVKESKPQKPEVTPKAQANATPKADKPKAPQVSPVPVVDPDDVF